MDEILSKSGLFNSNAPLFVKDVACFLKHGYEKGNGKNFSNDLEFARKHDPDNVRGNIIACNLIFPLNCVELKPSKIHGRGVFATKKIIKGAVATFYPADILVIKEYKNADLLRKQGLINVVYGSGITEAAKANMRSDIGFYADYGHDLISGYEIIGIPENDKNPAYLGHFINDCAKCTNDPRSRPIYMSVVMAKANCGFLPIHDLHVAAVALRDIEIGEELTTGYGWGYWTINNNK